MISRLCRIISGKNRFGSIWFSNPPSWENYKKLNHFSIWRFGAKIKKHIGYSNSNYSTLQFVVKYLKSFRIFVENRFKVLMQIWFRICCLAQNLKIAPLYNFVIECSKNDRKGFRDFTTNCKVEKFEFE